MRNRFTLSIKNWLSIILVVLVTTSNSIHNKIIRLEDNLTQEELEHTARYLNTEFSGKSLLRFGAKFLK